MATAKVKKKAATKRKTSTKQAGKLHLPSLVIKGFRGLKELHLLGLGRVTLLTGGNSAGKSTILEAAQLYASAGDPNVMIDILDNREDILVREDKDGDLVDVPDHGSLFFGYDEPKIGDTIEIGFPRAENMLKVELSSLDSKELKDVPSHLLPMLENEGLKCLAVYSGLNGKIVTKSPFFHSKRKAYTQPNELFMGGLPRGLRRKFFGRGMNFGNGKNYGVSRIPYESLGPGLPSNEKITSWYESMELTSEGEYVLEVLRYIKPDIERLASQGGRRFGGPRMVAKIKNINSPVPLKSMGEGIVHLLGLAVALISAKNGLLLIDEIENGIHHRLFPQLWEFVMKTAQKNDVQVIAATHSWDCFKGFAQVACKLEDAKGRVIRIDRKGKETMAVSYSEEEALIAAESGIEVR